jgi:flagellar basal body-associated protein FliL
VAADFTFDVLVLSAKSQWTSISRWGDESEARQAARKLVSGKKHQGVKILQEHFDEEEDRFVEKTIFRKMKSDEAQTFDEDDDSEYVAFDDYDDYDHDSGWILPVVGIFSIIAIVLGLGIFFFDDTLNFNRKSAKGYFVYKLPVVMTNLSDGEKNVSVKVSLQLELNDSKDSRAIEMALTNIMESVIDELQVNDVDELRESENIQLLRITLKEKIQDAVGDTSVNGVLFNDIQIFE